MPLRRIAFVGALAFGLLAPATVWSARGVRELSVRVPKHMSVIGNVRITLAHARTLPNDGYYYAVAVLEGYRGYSAASPPPCAVSSDMSKTAYGFPKPRRRLTLTLIPATSAAHRWCARGVYRGAVYAVPHAPRCTARYPCRGAGGQGGSCWDVEGRRVCGVVVAPPGSPEKRSPSTPRPAPPAPEPEVPLATPSYSYPGGLPAPVDRSSRIVARFTIRF